jgi:hypothetical protein
MHGTQHGKIINAQQSEIVNYKNTNLKLLKTSAAMWFNKICRLVHLLEQ